MKFAVIAAALILSTAGVFAQAVAPLTGNAVFVTEVAREVSFGWGSKMTWSGYVPREVNWSRTADGLEVLGGTSASLLVDTGTYLHYPVAAGVSQLSGTISQGSTREGRKLEPGTSWKADRKYTTVPVTYCSSNDHSIDSKFEVGPGEPYVLKIDGNELTIEVTPVVENGWWNRCYSGKRFTRFLVSRDLGAVVSIEHVGYTPQGHAHESSYRLNVKEIKTSHVPAKGSS
jgi:hypothetical protein